MLGQVLVSRRETGTAAWRDKRQFEREMIKEGSGSRGRLVGYLLATTFPFDGRWRAIARVTEGLLAGSSAGKLPNLQLHRREGERGDRNRDDQYHPVRNQFGLVRHETREIGSLPDTWAEIRTPE